MDFRPQSYARCVATALLLLLLSFTSSAHAAPSAAERETARSLMDEGDRLLSHGNLREALSRYRAAHAIMHVPTTGLDLARVQARLGMLVEARATAMEVVNLPRAESDDSEEPAVFQQARTAAIQLLRELEPRVPSLQTKLTPTPKSYQLTIDGVKLPDEARDAPFRTNPGSHAVRVEAPGFASAQREVVLKEGQTSTVTLALSPLEPAPLADETQQPSAAPAMALHTDSYIDARRAAGRARGIVGLSIGALGLVAGGVTGLIAMVQTRQEQQLCPNNHCDASRADELRTANAYANVANVSFAIGGLALAYGAFELLTLPTRNAESKDTRASIEVSVGGIRVRGTL